MTDKKDAASIIATKLAEIEERLKAFGIEGLAYEEISSRLTAARTMLRIFQPEFVEKSAWEVEMALTMATVNRQQKIPLLGRSFTLISMKYKHAARERMKEPAPTGTFNPSMVDQATINIMTGTKITLELFDERDPRTN